MPTRRSVAFAAAAFVIANLAVFTAGVIFDPVWGIHTLFMIMQEFVEQTKSEVTWLSILIVAAWPTSALALAILLFAQPRRPRDGETRCRRCDHILRSITKPECPECGERI